MPVKKPNARQIPIREIKEMLKDQLWVLDRDLTKQLASLLASKSNVYRHPDGRLLNVDDGSEPEYDGTGILYETEEDFSLLLQSLVSMQSVKPQHILTNRLPQGKDFIQDVPHLVDELPGLLNLPEADLDKSVDSLIQVDEAIEKIGQRECMEPPYFPALVAYAGEVLRTVRGGKWEMFPAQRFPEIWEPWIIDAQGYYCDPFLTVYKSLDEPPFSIAGAIYVEVRVYNKQR